MSNRPRRDGDRRPSDRGDRRERDDRGDRRDSQPDEEQQRRPGDPDLQESDSLTALKAILGKVAALLASLKLTQDECISLVEQLYGSVLDMDLKLAGETDDKRKSSVLAHIQNTNITRSGGKLVVEFPKLNAPKSAKPAATPATDAVPEAPASQEEVGTEPAQPVEPEPAQPMQPEPAPGPEQASAAEEPAEGPAPDPSAEDRPPEA